jgi:predicted metal-dependent phosphoesterase TrpH
VSSKVRYRPARFPGALTGAHDSLIDLHIHTTESDGTFSPAAVLDAAQAARLDAAAITDHDTFAGFDAAAPLAAAAGFDLICGIELSTKMPSHDRPRGKTVHLLGYWMKSSPAKEFRGWLEELQASRRDRNVRLVERLQQLGLDITLEEVQAIGRSMTGRPHFARVMVDKGYVKTTQEAFDKYLDERGAAYVDREEPTLAEGIRHIRASGGVCSLAHPVRLGRRVPAQEEDLIRQMVKMGLQAIEVYHSDHNERDTERYQWIARRYDLAVTGGSDFHGEAKVGVNLGSGRNGNVTVPNKVLDRLRILSR